MTKVGPFFKWFGSKWSGAKHYPKPLEGLPIFEPYAGGAGYSCNYADHDVVLWEINPHLSYLWRWLITEANSEKVLDIPLNLPEGTDIRLVPELDYGQQLLLKSWQRTNNVGNCWTISSWGNKPGQWTANTRARLAEEIYAIRHWKFESVPYDRPGTWFIDPPYQFNYQYRITDRFQYDLLTFYVEQIPAGSRIIACEAACPESGQFPTYLPFHENHRQVTSRRKTTENHHSRELIWTEDR